MELWLSAKTNPKARPPFLICALGACLSCENPQIPTLWGCDVYTAISESANAIIFVCHDAIFKYCLILYIWKVLPSHRGFLECGLCTDQVSQTKNRISIRYTCHFQCENNLAHTLNGIDSAHIYVHICAATLLLFQAKTAGRFDQICSGWT